MYRFAFVSGACLCFLSVLFGAFGAHVLESFLVQNQRLDTFSTASHYHFFHALALLVLGVVRPADKSLKTQRNASFFWF